MQRRRWAFQREGAFIGPGLRLWRVNVGIFTMGWFVTFRLPFGASRFISVLQYTKYARSYGREEYPGMLMFLPHSAVMFSDNVGHV